MCLDLSLCVCARLSFWKEEIFAAIKCLPVRFIQMLIGVRTLVSFLKV